MSKLNVIHKVGQVWTCHVIGGSVDREVSSITDNDDMYDTIHFKCGNTMSEQDIRLGNMVFRPSNDLEWLSVNCDEWMDGNYFVSKHNNKPRFTGGAIKYANEYTRKQWQDKRNELFGLKEGTMNIDNIAKKEEEDLKPVFTKEMCDNGELPRLGSVVKLRYKFDNKSVTHTGEVLYASLTHCILKIASRDKSFLIGDYVYETTEPLTVEDKLIADLTLAFKDHIKANDNMICGSKYIKLLVERFNISLKSVL